MNKKSIIVFMIFFSIAFAGIGELINNICYQLRALIPLISISLIVIAGLIYGIGKILGQEFRSKTESWATTIVLGALIGLILALSAPFIVRTIAEAMDLDESEYTCENLM